MKNFVLKLKIYSIFIILISCSGTISNKNNQNIEKYNSLILKAEKDILNKKFSGAENKYKEASHFIDDMYAVDINNALVASVLIRKWENSAFWSQKLIEKGISVDFFDKNIFGEFLETDSWREMENKVSIFQNTFNKSFDKNLLDSLEILTKADQEEYCQIPTGNIQLSDAFIKTKFLDSLLYKLIKNNGYPSEKIIGVNVINENYISPLPKFYPLLRHSYQANSNLLKEQLYNASKNGILKNDILEKISGIDNGDFVVIDCKIYRYKLSKTDKSKQDFMQRKIIFNNNGIYPDFILYAPLLILGDIKPDDFGDVFEKNYSYIDNYNECE